MARRRTPDEEATVRYLRQVNRLLMWACPHAEALPDQGVAEVLWACIYELSRAERALERGKTPGEMPTTRRRT